MKSVTIKVDSTEIDRAIEKARKLKLELRTIKKLKKQIVKIKL